MCCSHRRVCARARPVLQGGGQGVDSCDKDYFVILSRADASIKQTLTGLSTTKHYELSFLSAERVGYAALSGAFLARPCTFYHAPVLSCVEAFPSNCFQTLQRWRWRVAAKVSSVLKTCLSAGEPLTHPPPPPPPTHTHTHTRTHARTHTQRERHARAHPEVNPLSSHPGGLG